MTVMNLCNRLTLVLAATPWRPALSTIVIMLMRSVNAFSFPDSSCNDPLLRATTGSARRYDNYELDRITLCLPVSQTTMTSRISVDSFQFPAWYMYMYMVKNARHSQAATL